MLGADAWADHLDGDAALWLSTTYGIRIGTGPVRELLAALAQQHRRHPLQEYLDGLRWDGVPRLDTWLTYALGVEDSPLVRTLARRWLIQAVARATRPGCQADATLVLVGAQGKYKSSVVGALAGREFFSENPINIHGDTSDLVSLVHSAWIHDMSEGADVRRAEVDRLKQFLTTRVDIYRRKYGRNHEERPRFSVFVSTTNDDRFLPADPTGARRFWPVTCARGDVSWVESHRDQLWAEALVALASGERWHLVDEECSALIDHQSAYEQDDALTGRVGRWLREQATRLWVGGERGGREPITTEEVMGGPLGLTPEQMGRRSNEMRAGDILRRLHYTRRRVRSGEALIWAYVPSASVENPV
jgi:putative DNA primase/helicase